MTHNEYQNSPAINWSRLKLVGESPAHYRLGAVSASQDTLDFGTGFHCLVFEPMEFPTRFAVWPESAGQRRGKAWEAFMEEAGERTILREQDIVKIRAMAAAVRDSDAYADLMALTGGATPAVEAPMMWSEEVAGRRWDFKARPDFVAGPVLADLKSTMTTHAPRFGSQAARLGWHGQLAHYAAGCRAVYGTDPTTVAFVAVEKAAPHDVAVFQLLPEDLALGLALREEYLTRLAECLDRGRWPSRYEGIQFVRLPAWASSSEAVTSEDFDDEAGDVLAGLT